MSNIKPTFFTSDFHISHENVLKFDQRPFRDLKHMHESLITRYNASVTENGVCYFLGDMGAKTEDIHKVITRLNGIKILVLGNHDKGMNTMYKCGFDVVMHGATIYIQGEKVTLSHCPLADTWREDTSHTKIPNAFWHGHEKNTMFTVKNDGQFHLHGHIHSRADKPNSVKILDKQYDVGVAANNYRPVSISEIESWISLYKRDTK